MQADEFNGRTASLTYFLLDYLTIPEMDEIDSRVDSDGLPQAFLEMTTELASAIREKGDAAKFAAYMKYIAYAYLGAKYDRP